MKMTHDAVAKLILLLLLFIVIMFAYNSTIAVDSLTQINNKIAKQNAEIAKQQANIAKYQADIVNTNANNTTQIEKYSNYIQQANQKIVAANALIDQLVNSQLPPVTPVPVVPVVPSTTPGVGALKNASGSNMVLTHVTLLNGTCNPACIPMTTLPPGGVQSYSLSGSTGFIVFDYDIKNNTTRTGHLTITANSSGVILTNGLGGAITQGSPNFQVSYTPPVAYWRSQFTSLTNWAANNWKVTSSIPSWGQQNIEVKASAAGEVSPRGDNYIRIHYPAGSADYASGPPIGGAQFYGAMLNTNAPVTLSFYMLLPLNFPFLSPLRGTTVGKLPGLYGGIGNTGSHVPTGSDGWTTRFMWCDYNKATKQKFVGGGELLQFTVGSNKGLYGTVDGTFLGCGVWKFLADGKWHNIQQTVHLNDVGKTNGRIDVCIDGLPVFSQQNITFRTVSSLQTNGIIFQTFFGGGDSSYATPINTYADFADFALYMYPPTAQPGLCVTSP